MGDLTVFPVLPGSLGVPGSEDRVYRKLELFEGVGGELLTFLFLHYLLELLDHLFHVLRFQVGVEFGPNLFLLFFESVFKLFGIDTQHDFAEHLDEPAVGIVGEPLVFRQLRQPLNAFIVKPEVEDGVHHPRHREHRTGANGNKERVVWVAEAFVRKFFELAHGFLDFIHQPPWQFAAAFIVALADLGGDHEARGHGQSKLRHRAQAGTLAAQQSFVCAVALIEGVKVFCHKRASSFTTGGIAFILFGTPL